MYSTDNDLEKNKIRPHWRNTFSYTVTEHSNKMCKPLRYLHYIIMNSTLSTDVQQTSISENNFQLVIPSQEYKFSHAYAKNS